MARGQCTFRKRDVEMAVSAVRAAGCLVRMVEVDKHGKIRVIVDASLVSEPESAVAAETPLEANEWDAE